MTPREPYCAVIVVPAAMSSKSNSVGAPIAGPADNIVARAATCIHLANIHGILCSIINPRVFVTPHQMAVAVKAIRTFTVAPDVLVTVMVARPPAVVCAFRSDPPRFSPKWYVFPVVGSFNPSNARVTSGGLIVPTQRTEAERP